MPVTLQEAQKNVQDDLQMGIIDEFRKSSFIFDHITFDDVVSPTGGGTTMTYGYTRLLTQPTAGFRAINTEYAPQEVTKQRYTVDLKVFGGAYSIDRVIADIGGIISEVALQSQQKVKATSALFNDTVVNGAVAASATAFDGLEAAITGSSTEYIPDATIDLSTSDAVDSNWKVFLDVLDEFLLGLDGAPTMLAGNQKLIAKIRACARRAGMYQVTKNDFGQQITHYGDIPLVDLGAKPGTNDPVSVTSTAGKTSLYAVRFGLDGFHAISPAGQPPVKIWLPDYSTAGAVKNGEVELVAAVALKATKAAGILRDIKVAATPTPPPAP